jgi:hypothetical protein
MTAEFRHIVGTTGATLGWAVASGVRGASGGINASSAGCLLDLRRGRKVSGANHLGLFGWLGGFDNSFRLRRRAGGIQLWSCFGVSDRLANRVGRSHDSLGCFWCHFEISGYRREDGEGTNENLVWWRAVESAVMALVGSGGGGLQRVKEECSGGVSDFSECFGY